MKATWEDRTPTESGWYWVDTRSGPRPEYFEVTSHQTLVGHLRLDDYRMFSGAIIGPRIPLPEQLTVITNKAAKYDEMMQPTTPTTIAEFGEHGFTVTGWGVSPQGPTQ